MESPGGPGGSVGSSSRAGSGRGSPGSATPPGSEVALAQLQEDASSSMTLAWSDLSVWVRRRKEGTGLLSRQKYEHKQILNNVCGVAKSGTLMAIMGASGAGKTTLLATVSQRVKGITRGEILVNGHVVDQQFMCQVSGFVPQQDLAVECLTVREHLEFMARLKMDQRVRASQRHRRILSLLMDLGLSKCCHTQLRRLSGGERRRVSLAVQLLTDPPFLFCDEPTTGLDSYSAGAVVEHLRLFAARGKAVICTIHQPASGIFDLFHQVLLVANGRVAFFGDVADASRHFDNLGLVCPSTFNQAEFLVSQLAVIPGREGECLKKVQWLCDEFDSSKYGQALSDQLAAHTGRFLRSDSATETGALDQGLGHSLSRVGRAGRTWSVASEDSYEKEAQAVHAVLLAGVAVPHRDPAAAHGHPHPPGHADVHRGAHLDAVRQHHHGPEGHPEHAGLPLPHRDGDHLRLLVQCVPHLPARDARAAARDRQRPLLARALLRLQNAHPATPRHRGAVPVHPRRVPGGRADGRRHGLLAAAGAGVGVRHRRHCLRVPDVGLLRVHRDGRHGVRAVRVYIRHLQRALHPARKPTVSPCVGSVRLALLLRQRGRVHPAVGEDRLNSVRRGPRHPLHRDGPGRAGEVRLPRQRPGPGHRGAGGHLRVLPRLGLRRAVAAQQAPGRVLAEPLPATASHWAGFVL